MKYEIQCGFSMRLSSCMERSWKEIFLICSVGPKWKAHSFPRAGWGSWDDSEHGIRPALPYFRQQPAPPLWYNTNILWINILDFKKKSKKVEYGKILKNIWLAWEEGHRCTFTSSHSLPHTVLRSIAQGARQNTAALHLPMQCNEQGYTMYNALQGYTM